MTDIGLTHIALPVSNLDRSIAFYARYVDMQVVHRRTDPPATDVAWVTDHTRPFVIVLIQKTPTEPILSPIAHLGVGCNSKAEVDRRCAQAQAEGILQMGPTDSGPPIGYWAFI